MAEVRTADPVSPRAPINARGRGRGGSGSNHQYRAARNSRGGGLWGGRGERGGRARGRGDVGGITLMPDAPPGPSNPRFSGHAIRGSTTDSPLNNETVENDGYIGQRAVRDTERPVEEGEVCFICASTIEHLSIAPCNHQTCHICALRLRALYKKRDCAYCKVQSFALHF